MSLSCKASRRNRAALRCRGWAFEVHHQTLLTARYQSTILSARIHFISFHVISVRSDRLSLIAPVQTADRSMASNSTGDADSRAWTFKPEKERLVQTCEGEIERINDVNSDVCLIKTLKYMEANENIGPKC